jgi:Spy/CpxP family protein refolding chaperone
MRILGRAFLSVVFVGLVVSLVVAQPRPGGGRGFGGRNLLVNESVQKELKLSDEQIAQIKKITDEVGEKYKDDLTKLRKGGDGKEAFKKMAEIGKKMSEDTHKQLESAKILKPDQAKRFHQIEIQAKGSQAFNESDVATALKLTDDQKEKVKTIQEDARKEMGEGFKGGKGGFDKEKIAEAAKKFAAVRKETMERCLAVLTADQKKTWQELTGAPFEVKFEPRARPDKNKN